jgi:hypothetical protein
MPGWFGPEGEIETEAQPIWFELVGRLRGRTAPRREMVAGELCPTLSNHLEHFTLEMLT